MPSPRDRRSPAQGRDPEAPDPPLPVAPLDAAGRLACLRLIRSDNVGPATFRLLINHYGGAEEALAVLPDLARRSARRALRICTRDRAEAELAAAAAAGATPLFNIEPGFPLPLAVLEGAPPLLYCKGDIDLLSRPAVAVVGARDGSALGQKLARQMAAGLGAAGYVVVSGLARGIDGAAHAAALATGTVAVLAGGIDVIYPPEHAELHRSVGTQGCLVSEQPPGFQPRGQDFPRRNRIISGLSLAVVVVEAARRSGSLITARIAGEQGREVFAVPGHPLDPRAEGTNQLLKDGATLVTSAEDVVSLLAPIAQPERRDRDKHPSSRTAVARPVAAEASRTTVDRGVGAVDPGGKATAQVRKLLGPAPVDIDELARASGLNIRAVNVALIELALAGDVTFHGQQLVSMRSGPEAPQ